MNREDVKDLLDSTARSFVRGLGFGLAMGLVAGAAVVLTNKLR